MKKTILILAANPKDTPRLRLDREVREIENGLRLCRRRDDFILKQQWAPRPKDVRRAMLDVRPDIVHFCGHGEGTDGLAFENEEGLSELVDSKVLAGFFELFAERLECVFLNVCYSEVQAESIVQHIPYVVGMTGAIHDGLAVEFAVAFYDAIGARESVDFAFKLAENAIQWTENSGTLTPILKSKAIPVPDQKQGDRGHGTQQASEAQQSSLLQQYEMLREQLHRLKMDKIIETDTLRRFQMEKQIERIQKEISEIERLLG